MLWKLSSLLLLARRGDSLIFRGSPAHRLGAQLAMGRVVCGAGDEITLGVSSLV